MLKYIQLNTTTITRGNEAKLETKGTSNERLKYMLGQCPLVVEREKRIYSRTQIWI